MDPKSLWGLSATSTKHRDGFNRMIQDALDGRIDYILTKSVSRFARNTVSSLTLIRNSRTRAFSCTLRKKTSTPETPRASCSSRLLAAWRRKNPKAYPKTSPGGSASAWPTAKSPCPTNNFSATQRARTASWKSSRKKPRLYSSSTKCT